MIEFQSQNRSRLVSAPEDIAVPQPDEVSEITPAESTEILVTNLLLEESAADAKQVELEPSLAEIMVWKPEISEPAEAAVLEQPVEVPPVPVPKLRNRTPVENVETTPPEEKKIKSARKPRKTKRSAKNGKMKYDPTELVTK